MKNSPIQRVLGRLLSLIILAACLDTIALGQEAPRPIVNIATPRTAGDARPIVGAYYYPWYGVNDRPLTHDWFHLLRQKLEPDPTIPRHFLTVHGVGYRFVG